MFCKSCGNEVNEGAAFCPKCGAKIEIPADMRAEMAGNNGKSSTSDDTKCRSESERKPVKKGLLTAMVCSFIIIIAVVGGVLIFLNLEKPSDYVYKDPESGKTIIVPYYNNEAAISINLPDTLSLNRKKLGGEYQPCYDMGNKAELYFDFVLYAAGSGLDVKDSESIQNVKDVLLNDFDDGFDQLERYTTYTSDYESHEEIAGMRTIKSYLLDIYAEKVPVWICDYGDDEHAWVFWITDGSREEEVESLLESVSLVNQR